MHKARQKGSREGNMEEIQAPDLSHLRSGKSDIFHHLKINIKDHCGVALVHTSSTSQRTPKSKFV
jgi:hypothetical protein